MLGFATESSGSINKWSFKTSSTMCGFLGESGPGGEFEAAQAHTGPCGCGLIGGLPARLKRRCGCCLLPGLWWQRTMVSEIGSTSRQLPSPLPPPPHLGAGEEGHRCLPILNTLALRKAGALGPTASLLVDVGRHLPKRLVLFTKLTF